MHPPSYCGKTNFVEPYLPVPGALFCSAYKREGPICMCLVFKFGALDSYELRLENYYLVCNTECKKQSKSNIFQNVAKLQIFYKTNADLKSPALQDLFDMVISTLAFGVLPIKFPHQLKEGAEPHLRPQLVTES